MKKACQGMVVLALSGVLLVAAHPIPEALSADEVLSGNIKEADNKSGQSTNTGSGIKTNHIQSGAVTSAKIKDGTVATADLANSGVTSAKIKDGNVLAADLADGAVTAAKVGFYARVVVVDINGGGDFTSPVDAMNAVAALSPAPSAFSPVLVRIMPGTYEIGPNPVVMRPFVDIEGSGVGATKIIGSVQGISYPPSGAVVGAGNAEIRFLSVSNAAASIWVAGISVPPAADVSLLHVAIEATGVGSYAIGVFIDSAAPVLRQVVVTGSGAGSARGIDSSGSPTLTDVTARGVGGSVNNIGIYLGPGAPMLRRVTAAAVGASTGQFGVGNVGVYVAGSSPVISDTTATAAAGAYKNVGIRVEGAGEPVLTNVTASGFAAAAYGLETEASGDGTKDAFVVRADRCTIEGSSQSVSNDVEYLVRIGAGLLAGGPALTLGGTLKCVASYDANYDPLLPDCSNCVPAAGVFMPAGGPFGDAGACQAAVLDQAPTRCCSGGQSGFQYSGDPLLCAGFCN